MAEETARVEPCDRCGHGHRGVRIVPLDNPPCPECGNRMPNFDPAPDQGERDGLAERLEARADEEEGLRPANPTNLRAADTLRVGRAEAFREAAQMARDESSTEGGARPGDSPLNDTRTNSDRPWREDVARAFVTNRPAQPEGAGEARVDKPRMALRPYHDDAERLDDVVVEDVAMFRAEMMDDGHLWMACYFDKAGTAPDLHFSVIAGKTGRAQLHLSATDVPPHIDIDADEPAPSDTPTEEEGA